MENANGAGYDLGWERINYHVDFTKGSKRLKLEISMGPIPADELIRYDRSLARPYRTDTDGGTMMDTTPSELEVTLFDTYAIPPDGRTREDMLKLPAAIKRAVIREGVGGGWPDIEEVTDGTIGDLAATEETIVICVPANGRVFKLEHNMVEPEADDEMAYRRATMGALKSLPGRRRQEYLVL